MRMRMKLALAGCFLWLGCNGGTAVGTAQQGLAGGGGHTDTMAVIGDTPYGDFNNDLSQMNGFPALVDSINGDPDVSRVVHLGDIHSGKQHCYESWDQQVLGLFQSFDDPMIYTPGDNEWTDCNKSKEGGHGDAYAGGDPLANLALVRSLFFPDVGVTLGRHPAHVQSQARVSREYRDFVENVMWTQSGVVFVDFNFPGSNNDTLPWFGSDETDEQRALQANEVATRTAADNAWLDRAFAKATEDDAPGIVIMTQVNFWDEEAAGPGGDGTSAEDDTVLHLANLALAFGKPVLLLNGDTHVYEDDNPLLSTDPHYHIHPIGFDVPNFYRITVQSGVTEWVKLTVNHHDCNHGGNGPLFSWVRIPVAQ